MRQRSLKARKWLAATGTLVTVGGVALLAMASIASAQVAPVTWKVWNGLEATETGRPPTGPQDLLVASNDFQPRPLEIHVGDTVQFINSGNFHTVALGRGRLPLFAPTPDGGLAPNPAVFAPMGGNVFDGTGVVQSGALEGPATFNVTFTRPGEFLVICDVHEMALPEVGMAMTVRVKSAGEPLAMTPQQAEQAAMSHFLNDWATRAMPLIAQLSRIRTGHLEDGTVVREVAAGFGDGHVEGLRFLPEDLVVREGDWIRWINPDPEAPHTITLFPGGGLPEGPPPPDVDPIAFAFASTPDSVYTGENFINKFVSPNPAFAFTGAGDSATIQFATPGDYTYVCLLHLQVGMWGTVTVLPR